MDYYPLHIWHPLAPDAVAHGELTFQSGLGTASLTPNLATAGIPPGPITHVAAVAVRQGPNLQPSCLLWLPSSRPTSPHK